MLKEGTNREVDSFQANQAATFDTINLRSCSFKKSYNPLNQGLCSTSWDNKVGKRHQLSSD